MCLRTAIYVLCAALSAGFGFAAEPTPSGVDPQKNTSSDLTSALDALVNQLAGAGFPVWAKASIVVGNLEAKKSTVAQPDSPFPAVVIPSPALTQLPFQKGSERGWQNSDSGAMTWHGVHLQLSDGSWIAGLTEPWMRTSSEGISFSITNKEADASQIIPGLFTDLPELGSLLPLLDAPTLAAYNAAMKRLVPNLAQSDQKKPTATEANKIKRKNSPLALKKSAEKIGLRPECSGIGLVFLYQAGIANIDDLLFVNAIQEQLWTERWQLPLSIGGWTWDKEGDSILPRFPNYRRRLSGLLGTPNSVAILQRQVAWWMAQLSLAPEKCAAWGTTQEQVLRLAVSCVPEPERDEARRFVTLLHENQKISINPPVKTDLVTKLQIHDFDRWHGKFDDLDIPQLIDLLDDPRPTAWIDRGIPRTVGDCAFEALSNLLSVDVRKLFGLEYDVAWTAAERAKAAEVVRTWWKKLGNRPLAEGLVEIAPIHLTPGEFFFLVVKRPENEQPLLIDCLAKVLPSKQLPDSERWLIHALLEIAPRNKALTEKISAWPITGIQAHMLALWHDKNNNPQPFDALLDQALSEPLDKKSGNGNAIMALRWAICRPSTARLERCLAATHSPDLTLSLHALMACSNLESFPIPQEWGWSDAIDKRTLMTSPLRLSLLESLLKDRRPLPADAVVTLEPTLIDGSLADESEFNLMYQHQVWRFEIRVRDKYGRMPSLSEQNLRLCDLAAYTAADDSALINIFFPCLAVDPRDSEIKKLLTTVIAPRAAAERVKIGLPQVLPTPAPINVPKSQEPSF